MQTFGPRQYFVRANTLFCRQCFVAANILSSPIFCLCLGLKVVGNEKGGGTGGWLLFKDGSGPWRSMSVCFLMLPSSFLQSISISCL
jgi:hypothetical protein